MFKNIDIINSNDLNRYCGIKKLINKKNKETTITIFEERAREEYFFFIIVDNEFANLTISITLMLVYK